MRLKRKLKYILIDIMIALLELFSYLIIFCLFLFSFISKSGFVAIAGILLGIFLLALNLALWDEIE